jgi:hypothetical protein
MTTSASAISHWLMACPMMLKVCMQDVHGTLGGLSFRDGGDVHSDDHIRPHLTGVAHGNG